MERLQALLKERDILIFAHIDFSATRHARVSMRPEQMLIFGNPKAGTPLMWESPLAGLDLPLKALAWKMGRARPGSPTTIRRTSCGHGLTPALGANLAAVAPIVALAAGE